MTSCPVWPCPPDTPLPELSSLLSPAVSRLQSEQVVAIPTETVYGLAGSAYSTAAVARIFAAKGRPADNPLIVHSPSVAAVQEFCLPLSPLQSALASAFWPGPLTLLLSPRPDARLSPLITAGRPRVAVRVPSHPVASALLSLCRLPLAAPSANLSGRPSPTSAQHVQQDLAAAIAGIVDSGRCAHGLESTVLSCDDDEQRICILRPGAVTRSMIAQLLPGADIRGGGGGGGGEEETGGGSGSEAPLAPGMKYAHYRPRAAMAVLDGSLQWRRRRAEAELRSHRCVGLLCSSEEAQDWTEAAERWREDTGCSVHVLVLAAGAAGIARDLFAALRAMDDLGAELILASAVDREGVGEAVMNRLSKAAAGRLWREADDVF